MGFDTKDFARFTSDLNKMAEELTSEGEGSAVNKTLHKAAEPILDQMKANASTDPKVISGDLRAALDIGKGTKGRGGSKYVTIGVHRKDWTDHDEYYPAYVEFGHGGQHPAPPHPYVRPAFDTKKEEAYSIIKDGLSDAISKL